MLTNENLEYAKIVLADSTYEALKKFFMKVWRSKSEFIVFCTQRSSMLHSIFLPIAPSGTLTLNRCITANAFLLYAEEFANIYKESGRFPEVIFVEDVRFSGVNTDCIWDKFYQRVIEKLSKNQKLSDNDKYNVARDLRAAIKIYVYAMHEYGFGSLRGLRVDTFETKQRSDKLRTLFGSISGVIRKLNVVNTNFHFSIKVPESFVLKDGKQEEWYAMNWNYRHEKQIVYFSSNADKEKLVSSVCIHGFEKYNRGNQIWLTGIPIWIEMVKNDFDKICNIMKSVLETSSSSSEFRWIQKLLACSRDNVLPVKAQFISFVLSVLSVYAFCEDCGLSFDKQQILNNSNAEFIAINFGKSDDVWSEFEELCTNKCLLSNLKNELYSAFDENSKSVGCVEFSDVLEDEVKEINRVFENIYYQARLLQDVNYYEARCNKRCFLPNERGADLVLVSDVLSKASKHQTSKGKQMDYYACFACQIALMNSGLITISFEYSKAINKIECAFKADELAAFVLHRRLKLFIPALRYVEREEYDKNAANKLLKEFIEYILSANNNPENEMECEALKCLREQGNEFIDMLYKLGQRVWEWDIPLSHSDFREQQYDNYLSFRIHYGKRQNYYETLAVSFAQKKWNQRFQ